MRTRRLHKVIGTMLVVLGIFAMVLSTAHARGTVTIGINVPLTGAYWQQGKDQLKAYELAVKQVNQDGGVNGSRVETIVMDTKTNAKQAAENARAMIRQGAVMVTGGSSSSTAISQGKVCEKAGIVFMAGLTHSNATTGTEGVRHSFRWYNNAHQSAKAMATTLADRFGKGASYAIIYADYTWGQSVQGSMVDVLEKGGANIALSEPVPLGTKKMGYLDSMIKADATGADVLVLVLFGQDMVDGIKLVKELGMDKKMALVVPLMELHMANQAGPETMEGVITSMTWYHGLSDEYKGSRDFVSAFERAYGKKPGNAAATAWVNIFQWADAARRAKSFEAKKVIPALEDHKFTLLTGEETWRGWDHQGIHPTFVAVGKSPSQSRDQWDLFNIIDAQRGEDVARTREENPVELAPLE